MIKLAALPTRTVLAISGEDRVGFLQGLVSNDVAAVAPARSAWAALLTPQGKWLADFFIFSDGERLLLDCERPQLDMLSQRLTRYRLRSRVSLSEADLAVYVAWDSTPDGPRMGAPEMDVLVAKANVIMAPDPRLAGAGWRILSGTRLPDNATEDDWDARRLVLGLPDGSRDMEAEKSILLEAGFDELNGVSWTKGCYMGQELTARTKYRGLVKRRLVPVTIDGAAPPSGTPILRDGREVGTMRSANGRHGLAVLRLDVLRLDAGGPALISGETTLTPLVPDWMRSGSE